MIPVSDFNAAAGPPRTAVASRFSEMTSEDFIRIIFTELANQDPLAPSDSSALLDQLNSIRSIESDLEMINRLESLVLENQLAAGANLIGKVVTGLTEANDRVSGKVVSVVRNGDTVSLELENGRRVPIDFVEMIQEATAQPTPFITPQVVPNA